jgi:membrane-associated phospholipid phosphatase
MITNTKSGLVLLLLLVFLANLVETSWETSEHGNTPVSAADYKGAYAVKQFERGLISFEFHDKTSRTAMYAYSTAYFVLFPLLAFGLLFALMRRAELPPFRVLCLAIAADYLVSLPWFLLYPVPERWAYPESSAILLSDLWSSKFIDSIRPLSGINNSFPSTHVSLTVIMIAVAWLFHVRFRSTLTALGMLVIVSTFALGIHWVADIIAGAIVGVLSVAIAWRFTDTSERLELAGATEYATLRKRPRPMTQLVEPRPVGL